MLSRGGDTAIQPLTAEAPCKDEARIGQKNKITRRWAKRGSRPSAPRDQRTASSYIFGAICPERGVGAVLVLPWCNSATMSLHLAEISQAVSPGAHAVVLLDQAGWHTSAKLNVPANISLLALPPKSPELEAAACRIPNLRQRRATTRRCCTRCRRQRQVMRDAASARTDYWRENRLTYAELPGWHRKRHIARAYVCGPAGDSGRDTRVIGLLGNFSMLRNVELYADVRSKRQLRNARLCTIRVTVRV